MSLQPLIPALVMALVASVAGMTAGIASGQNWLVPVSAALFAGAIVGVALRVNRPLWTGSAASPEEDAEDLVHAARRNTRLAALTYAWGAAAMFTIYSLSGLTWRHSWQYGLGAALIACGLLWIVHRLGQPQHRMAPPLALTGSHAAAVAGGLAHLVASGAVWTEKSGWAANPVFLAGGFALLALCAVAAVTQMRIVRRLAVAA